MGDCWVPKDEESANKKSTYLVGFHLFLGILVIIAMSIFAKVHADNSEVYDMDLLKSIPACNICIYVACGLLFVLVIIQLAFWIRLVDFHTHGLYNFLMILISLVFSVFAIVPACIGVHQSSTTNYGDVSEKQYKQRALIDDCFSETKDVYVMMLIVWLIDFCFETLSFVFFFLDYEIL